MKLDRKQSIYIANKGKDNPDINNFPELQQFLREKEKPKKIIYRSGKGLKMIFYTDLVIKHYYKKPKNIIISQENQIQRLINEISAYQHFNKNNCQFVPKLINFSIKERWLCITRIEGADLLELSQLKGFFISYKNIINQVDNIANWLVSYSFPIMKNNIKDLILSESGKIYIIDFEDYSNINYYSSKEDLYDSLICDIMDRIIIRHYRKAKFTSNFILLSIFIMLHRPFKSFKHILYYLFLKIEFIKPKEE